MADLVQSVTIAGLSIQGRNTQNASAEVSIDKTGSEALPAAKAGSLTTRTDADTGVVTLSGGHGITNGMVVDVYWDGGVRYGMDATVATNAVTVDAGAGDDLPVQDTAVTLSEQVVESISFAGSNVVMMAASASKKSHIEFFTASATKAGVALDAGGMWAWHTDSGFTNPLASATIATARMSNGDSTAASDVKLAVEYDSGS